MPSKQLANSPSNVRSYLGPLAQLRGHESSITSLCLLPGSDCVNSAIIPSSTAGSSLTNVYATSSLLASCDSQGNAFLWNVATRRIAAQFGSETQADPPGLVLRRLDSAQHPNRFLYHTRGTQGTVRIFDVDNLPPPLAAHHDTNVKPRSIWNVNTKSLTFCSSNVCVGDEHLIVTPSANECVAHIYDIREKSHVLKVHGAGRPGSGARNYNSVLPEHGMLTSLGMCSLEGSPIVACGMESGDLYFHDCRHIGTPFQILKRDRISPEQKQAPTKHKALSSESGMSLLSQSLENYDKNDAPIPPEKPCNADDFTPIPKSASIKLSNEPVLALDVVPSAAEGLRSVIAISGCAGDAATSMNEATQEMTGAIVRASFGQNGPDVKLRTRFQTCDVSENAAGGKPGISYCKFRSDGRVFAVGGWDHRARVVSRKGTMLAILKGHDATVTTVDWSAIASSGLLATGSGDGRIYVWQY